MNVPIEVNLDNLGLESKTPTDSLGLIELGSLGSFTPDAQSGLGEKFYPVG